METRKLKLPKALKEKASESGGSQFPIVGIGASAGGLEALEQFLGSVPEKSGMAYVVIQHLDPTQRGMLPELLQRVSKMKVFQVKERMAVKPDCVYVIPPNSTLSILKGILHLSEPIEVRGMRLPIDYFFRSLANDRQERAVGVILSGMGSDGSIGLRAIKENNGIVMVQEPGLAKFDSMPRNAIDSVTADIVAPAFELPSKLMALLKHIPIIITEPDVEIKDKSSLEKIISLLRNHTRNDFSLYKKNTVYRRIERRMGVHKIAKISDYVNYLRQNPKEAGILFKELMIGVTNFFRDTAVWEELKTEIIPDILVNRQSNPILRAWVPACSTGEEAYSLAIVFKEVLEKLNHHSGYSLQIFATDLDNEAIEIARKGIFPVNIAADVSQTRLNRFFVKTDEGYRVRSEIREMIVFANHNIIMHPPFTKIDILSCRNLLIYMEPELQKKLLGLFYYSINHEGILVLGSAETPGAQSNLFTSLDSKAKIYRRYGSNQIPESFDFPSSFSQNKLKKIEKEIPVKSIINIQTLADQLLLEHFSPAGVLVNDKGDIIYISGRTGKYLEPSVGKANMNIFAMLREGLRNEFPVAFRKAIKQKEAVVLRNIKVGTNGGSQIVNVNIQWIENPEPLHGTIMIIFNDVQALTKNQAQSKNRKKALTGTRYAELENEAKLTREEAQNTLEEMQTSQEELKSANEELQSTNEELQSTNEELTSSKEEMQSLNEELQTVNAELQSKVDEFTRVNNDMKNLLNSTDIATLFLDKELNIRRYTNQATKIFKLIKSDIGRPFTDLVSDLIYPELATDALIVLQSLIFTQNQIPTKDGRWFSVRIMPYRTLDDRIDGLVITFINISDLKKLEFEIHKTEQVHHILLASSTDIIIKLSPDWNILEFSTEAEHFFGKRRVEAINKNYMKMFIPAPWQKKTEKELTGLLKEGADCTFKMKVKAAGGKMAIIDWSVHILLDKLKVATGMILITKNSKSHD